MDSKYYTDSLHLREYIQQYGIAIIPNVLTDKECSKSFHEMWDYFEYITSKMDIPLQRTDNKTWNTFYDLFPMHSMLIQHWGVGHSQFAWNLRKNKKILDIYSNFWNVKAEDLLVSFDGCSFHLPPEITKRGYYRGNTWYHSDQSFTRNELECIQSFITLNDINEGDATLSIMEKSNLYHKEFADFYDIKDKKDWYKLSKEEEEFYRIKGCNIYNITCPKGSLVIWDSRTIHCGIESIKNRKKPNIRAICYLCYCPRNKSTDKFLEKKRKAFNNLRTTSHWPHKAVLFPKTPRTYGKNIPNIPEINKPKMDELSLKLAGF
tara:strand:- start:288 stop:1247 length:960 start_codon:yes stop_codon:yes gene_type:complete